jgi:hypothetical protein
MCPHRTFRDDLDVVWNAWDVIPSWGERRSIDRRRLADGPPVHSGERRRRERRIARGIRIALTPRLANGWLAFESDDARRRLAPIPEEWHLLPDEGLRELWNRAEHLPRRRRLVE